MKMINKKVVASVLSMAMMLGTSATAFGASGAVNGTNIVQTTENVSATESVYGQIPQTETKEYLVTYKNEQGKQDALSAGTAVKQSSLLDSLNMVTVSLTLEAFQQLLNNENITNVEENITFSTQAADFSTLGDLVTISSYEQTAWGVQALQADKAWNLGYTGKGVKIAVLDTGAISHNDLSIAGGVSTVDYTTSYQDDNGHGTHVTGILAAKKDGFGIAGIAPDAEVYAVKVLDKSGNGTVASIVAGINWAIENHVDIINMSVGTKTYVSTIDTMLRKATDQGILVVASAGNNGNAAGVGETLEYPANLPNVIAVEGVDKKLKRGSFSGTGKQAEISAPGVDIVSTSIDGGYESRTGTSMASPYVAGVLAIMKQANPTKSATELREMLDNNAIDLGVQGRDIQYGYGFIDLTKLIPSAPASETPSKDEQTTPSTPTQTVIDPKTLKDAISAVEYAEKYKQYAIYINRAVDKVKLLPNSDEKNALIQRLQVLGAMTDAVITPSQDTKQPTTPVDPNQQTDQTTEPVQTPTQTPVQTQPTIDPTVLKAATSAVEYAEKYKQYEIYINRAVDKVKALPEGTDKDALVKRMHALGAMLDVGMGGATTNTTAQTPTVQPPTKTQLDQVERYVGYAEKYRTSLYINKAKELINDLPDCPEKVAFQKRIDVVVAK